MADTGVVRIPEARSVSDSQPAPDLQPAPVVGPAAVVVRPLVASDGDRLLDLGSQLSARSRYLRFFSPLRTLPGPLLARLVAVDHLDREALAAVADDRIVGVARYDRSEVEPDVAEIAVVVADAWQRRGIASRLLSELGQLAAGRNIRTFTASTLVENRETIRLLHQLWPTTHGRYSDGVYRYRLPLGG